MRFLSAALLAVVALEAPGSGRPSEHGTLKIRFLGQCVHATDRVRIEFSAYKPYGGGTGDERQIVLRNGYYSAALRPDYYLITLFMKNCVANFDAGVYNGATRSLVVAPYPVIWRNVATAQLLKISDSTIADVYEMPRNGLLVIVPYDGLMIYLKDHSGKTYTPITEGRSNYFDDVFGGDYTLVVSSGTDLRSFPIKFAGDFSTRTLRLLPRDVLPPHATPVPSPEE
jgi:hypothetical protein